MNNSLSIRFEHVYIRNNVFFGVMIYIPIQIWYGTTMLCIDMLVFNNRVYTVAVWKNTSCLVPRIMRHHVASQVSHALFTGIIESTTQSDRTAEQFPRKLKDVVAWCEMKIPVHTENPWTSYYNINNNICQHHHDHSSSSSSSSSSSCASSSPSASETQMTSSQTRFW